MNYDALISTWKAEERIAHIHGWDFSHIEGRYTEQDHFPWDYRAVIGQYLRPEKKLLDIDTGGGEFLLSLKHPYENTTATENYPPNVQLCKDVLLPLGVKFRQADGKGNLPFDDGSFDIVINRHGDFHPEEIYRVLKPGGLFITQQVGAENDRELVKLLCGETPMPFPDQYLELTTKQFKNAGFTILREEECFRPIRFLDVGALVWFARIIQWEFPGFSVDTHLENLLNAQQILEENGSIDGSIHRFFLVAQKGENVMTGFEQEAKEKWGQTQAYKEYEEKHHSKQAQDILAKEMDRIMAAFATCMKKGEKSDSAQVQSLVKCLQNYITENYYRCTIDILANLGQMYVADARFKRNIDKHADGTAAFICKTIAAYCHK